MNEVMVVGGDGWSRDSDWKRWESGTGRTVERHSMLTLDAL